MKSYYVYIATNRSETLYVGVTNDIERRMYEHKSGGSNFTSKYQIDTLVYLEEAADPLSAIAREKQLKRWSRTKKIKLIESMNPKWVDLQTDLSTTLEATIGDRRA